MNVQQVFDVGIWFLGIGGAGGLLLLMRSTFFVLNLEKELIRLSNQEKEDFEGLTENLTKSKEKVNKKIADLDKEIAELKMQITDIKHNHNLMHERIKGNFEALQKDLKQIEAETKQNQNILQSILQMLQPK